MRSATRLIRSASATDEPPYFCTIRATARCPLLGVGTNRFAQRSSGRGTPGQTIPRSGDARGDNGERAHDRPCRCAGRRRAIGRGARAGGCGGGPAARPGADRHPERPTGRPRPAGRPRRRGQGQAVRRHVHARGGEAGRPYGDGGLRQRRHLGGGHPGRRTRRAGRRRGLLGAGRGSVPVRARPGRRNRRRAARPGPGHGRLRQGGRARADHRPRVEHLFTDWIDALVDRATALSVAVAPLLPGASGTCYSVESTSAALAPPVDPGIYCYRRGRHPHGGQGVVRHPHPRRYGRRRPAVGDHARPGGEPPARPRRPSTRAHPQPLSRRDQVTS